MHSVSENFLRFQKKYAGILTFLNKSAHSNLGRGPRLREISPQGAGCGQHA